MTYGGRMNRPFRPGWWLCVASAAFAFTAALVAASAAGGELPKTAMTERGRLIFSEDFSAPLETAKDNATSKAKKLWRPANGKWEFVDGAMTGAQIEGGKSAINYFFLPFQDAVIEFDVQVNGCNRCIFRVNDYIEGRSTGEHLFRVTLRKDGLVAQKDDHDHEGPDTAVPFGEIKRPFEPGEWKTVLIEILGENMAVTMDGKSVAGRHPLIATAKDNIGFGVTGQSAAFRRLRIWEAMPRKE